MSENVKRQNWIIGLRAFACMAVVMAHVIEGWLVKYKGSLPANRFILDKIVFQTMTKWSSHVFFMITGCLLLDHEKKMPLEKIRKYIKKMLFSLFVFGYTFCVIESIIKYKTDGGLYVFEVAFFSFDNLLQQMSWGHMWYLYALIGLYILTPVLRGFVVQCDDGELKFVIIALFFFSVVIPDVNNILKTRYTSFYLGEFRYIFDYLIGYTLHCRKAVICSKVIYACGAIGVIGYVTLSAIGIYNINQEGIFIVLIGICVFVLFEEKDKIKYPKIIEVISENSFGIYLIHTFWINLANKGLHIHPDILPAGIGELSFFMVTLVLSMMGVMVMKKIPMLRKLI